VFAEASVMVAARQRAKAEIKVNRNSETRRDAGLKLRNNRTAMAQWLRGFPQELPYCVAEQI